jgi:hypothetical protein
MHNENNHTNNPYRKARFILSKLALGLLFITFMLCIFIFAISAGKFEVVSTKLILKREGCSLLRQNGITTHGFPDEDTCTAKVNFRAYKFSNGGVIFLGEREIILAGNQIVAYELLDDQPLTPAQIKALVMLVSSSFVMLVMLVWLLAI